MSPVQCPTSCASPAFASRLFNSLNDRNTAFNSFLIRDLIQHYQICFISQAIAPLQIGCFQNKLNTFKTFHVFLAPKYFVKSEWQERTKDTIFLSVHDVAVGNLVRLPGYRYWPPFTCRFFGSLSYL